MAQGTEIADPTLVEESVHYLQELLRIDTTNPPGNELQAVEYLAGVLRENGYDPQIIESAPGRGNVVARLAGTGEREPLLIYGHLDVVPAEPKHWSHGPFSGDLADGCVWGRGALDMKSMVAQELMVMLLLQRSGVPLQRDIIFAATADEEVGGAAGIGFLVDNCPDLIRAEYALSEGAGATAWIGGRAFYDIRTAEKGTCRFKLRAVGQPGHGAIPLPDTAVNKVAAAVHKLASTPLPFRATATAALYFEKVAFAVGMPPMMRQLTERNVRDVGRLLPLDLAHYLHAITHDTAVPTGLSAGSKINVIPGEAEAWIDGRYLPGQTLEGFLDEIRRVIGSECEIELVDLGPPLEDPPDDPLYEKIVSVLRRREPRAMVAPTMLSGATDAKHVARLGAKCLGFGPVRLPEGFPVEHMVHGHDERIPVEGYVWGLHVLHDIVREFCTGD